jgi:twitching motility protein PilU
VSQRLVRTVEGARVPAVEVMLNTKLVAELIEKGDFSGVKEAMEKSMAEGSQTFEKTSGPPDHRRQDRPQGRPGLRRLAHQPDVAPAKRLHQLAAARMLDDQPSFTDHADIGH